MAGHHHHNHHSNHPTNCCSSSLGHGCPFNCDSVYQQALLHCHPPPLPIVDPLLESFAAHKLYAQTRQFHAFQNPNDQVHIQQQRKEDQRSTDLLISSLVSRIETLEASLVHSFRPSQPREAYNRRRRSLREVAARAIQTHFRTFLVRRSRTLGQLRELAVVKSSFGSLRSSISDEKNADLYGIARKAVDLLVKLDSIQGDDSMVRDGKRSISRDLVRFLEFVEGLSVKRRELLLQLKARETNVRFGQNGDKRRVIVNRKKSSDSDLDSNRREIIGKLKERVEKIRGYTRVCRNDDEDVVLEGFQHVSDEEDDDEDHGNGEDDYDEEIEEEKSNLMKKKSVSFAENRNVLKLFNGDAHCLDGDSMTSSDDRSQDVEEIKVFSIGDEDENAVNDIEASSYSRREGLYEIRGRYEGKDGEFLFSAPLPVKMEEKAEFSMMRRS